jgi:hypothetical protein
MSDAEEDVLEWLALGRSRARVRRKLEDDGVSSEEAKAAVEAGCRRHAERRRRRLAVYRTVGIVLLLAGAGTTLWGFYGMLSGHIVICGLFVAVGVAGLIITIDPDALEHFEKWFR